MPRLNPEIGRVADDSIAQEIGIQVGDRIVEVNGQPLYDILQYQHATAEAALSLTIERDGERTFVEIEKEEEDPIGLDFKDDLFDGIRKCSNNCVFCFVYQNPQGLRKSLYIKDEDFRYSFLYGNYVTLTNLSEGDMNRIVDERLSPIYVSVHATDQKVRDMLLGKKSTPPLKPRLDFLTSRGIDFYAQLVLIPGINDGKILDKSLEDLQVYQPRLKGITGVPVGLTRYRDFLFDIKPYERDGARAMIDYCRKRQDEFYARFGTRLFFLSDEFYLTAQVPFPPPAAYEGFGSLQDGVGMIPLFLRDLNRILPRYEKLPPPDRKALIITGEAAGPMFRDSVLPSMREAGWPVPELHVVKNEFFGSNVDVAGLLTARDIRYSFKVRPDVEFAMICDYMLKTGTEVFLDDITLNQLESQVGIRIIPVTDSPKDMLRVFRDARPSRIRRTRSGWEAETLANGTEDRFHPLPDGPAENLKPLFAKPNAVWGKHRM